MKNSIRVKLKKTISLLSACTLLFTSVAPLAETVFVTDAYAAEEAMEIPDEAVTEIPEAPDYEEAAVEVPDAGSEAGDVEYPDAEQPDEAESSDSSEAIDDENTESDASLAPASSGSKKGIIYWNSDTPAVFLEGATDTVRVTVSAGIGAFPEGVAMNLKPADDEKTLSRIKKTVEKDGETKVADVLAVDITFVDAEGYEIEPAAPICVTMTDLTRTEIAGEIDQHGNEIRIEAENPTESAEAASNEASEDAEQPDAGENDIEIAAEDGTSASADVTALAVHIDEKGRGELLPTPTDIHIKWNEEEIEENTKALQEVFADSSVIFEAEKFSVYAIVYTESNTETISDTDTDDSETEDDSELSWPGDTPSVFLEGDTDEVHVTVAAGVGVLPEGVTMTVSPVTDEDVLDRIRAAAEEGSEESVSAVQAVDILFFDADGNEVKPAGTVCVTMKDLTDEAEASAENNVAVSLDADGNSSLPETPEEIHIEWKDEEIEENTAVLQQVFANATVIFETEEPGVCAIVTRTIEKTLEASDGNTYVITVNYDNTSGIPANAELSVSEIKEGEEGYDDYVAQSAKKLGQEVEAFSLAKAFDITLTDPETGEKYQPNKNVSVSIRLLEEDLSQDGEVNVVHFGNEVEVLDCAVNEDAVEFESSGFSVYVIVEAKKPYGSGDINVYKHVQNLAELSDPTTSGIGFYLSCRRDGGRYFTNTVDTTTDNKNPKGRYAYMTTQELSAASKWYFESKGTTDTFTVYTYINGEKRYMKNNTAQANGNGMDFADANAATSFILEKEGNDRFYFHQSGTDKYLQYSNGGQGIRLYKGNGDKPTDRETNSEILITYADTPYEYYELNGKSYSIAYLYSDNKGIGLSVNEQGDFSAHDLDADNDLWINADNKVVDWTFECINGANYSISTQINGRKNYLAVNNGSLTLSNDPFGFAVNSDTEGRYSFSASGLYLSANKNMFGVSASAGDGIWLNLVQKMNLYKDVLNDFVVTGVDESTYAKINDNEEPYFTRNFTETNPVVVRESDIFQLNLRFDEGQSIEQFVDDPNAKLFFNLPEGFMPCEADGSELIEEIEAVISGPSFDKPFTCPVTLNDRQLVLTLPEDTSAFKAESSARIAFSVYGKIYAETAEELDFGNGAVLTVSKPGKLTVSAQNRNTEMQLSGVTFAVYDTGSSDTPMEGKSDLNDTVVIEDEPAFEYDKIYYVRQETTLANYHLPDDFPGDDAGKVYFYFSDNPDFDVTDYPEAVNLMSALEDTVKKINNIPMSVAVNISKTWGKNERNAWPVGVSHIRAALYQSVNGGEETQVGSVIAFEENSNPEIFSGLPAQDDQGNNLTYRIEEIGVYSDAGGLEELEYIKNIPVSSVTPCEGAAETVLHLDENGCYNVTFAINNQRPPKTFTVTEKWHGKRANGNVVELDRELDDSFKREIQLYRTTRDDLENGDLVLTEDLRNPDNLVAGASCTLNNKESHIFENLDPENEYGAEYHYYAIEKEYATDTIHHLEDDSMTVKDYVDVINYTVVKNWVNEDGTPITDPEEIKKLPDVVHVNMYRSTDETVDTTDPETAFKKLNIFKDENWTTVIQDLERVDGNGTSYTYGVQETNIDGFKPQCQLVEETHTFNIENKLEKPVLVIIANDLKKKYDSTALEPKNTNYKLVDRQALKEGHHLSVTVTGSQTNVGDSPSIAKDAVIVDANGDNVTDQYAIFYVDGTLEVEPKEVTITAKNAEKPYDGTPLTCDEFTATDLEEGDEHTFAVSMTTDSTITQPGTQPNVIAAVDGTAVTPGTETSVGNYLVTVVNGILTVNPKVTIKKIVKGWTDSVSSFEFTLILTNADSEPVTRYDLATGRYLDQGEQPSENAPVEDPQNPGTYTFKINLDDSDKTRVFVVPLHAGMEILENNGNKYYEYDTSITEEDSGAPQEGLEYTLEDIQHNTSVDVTNTRGPICKIGTEKFTTLADAMLYVQRQGMTNAAIEMLLDYAVPADDPLTIPSGVKITLTTSTQDEDALFTPPGNEQRNTAILRRHANNTDAFLIDNAGELILKNITLDGNNDNVSAACAMVENTGTLTIQEDATLRNAVSTGNGGAIHITSGSLTVSDGCMITENTALNGGAVYMESGSVNISGGEITGNHADYGNGGAIYTDAANATVSVSCNALQGNEALNGGAIYAKEGSVEVTSGGVITGNSATNNGGAIAVGSGTVTVSDGSISNNIAAVNGSAVFVGSGSAVFSGGDISGNSVTGSEGGAIGIGVTTTQTAAGSTTSTDARLSFSGNVRVFENTMGPENAAVASNVYLNVDSDAVIIDSVVEDTARIGIHVPGDYGSELFKNRGQACSSFAAYDDTASVDAFVNDRVSALMVTYDVASRKLLWGKPFKIIANYKADFSETSRPSGAPTRSYTYTSYWPVLSEGGVSELADDLYKNHKLADNLALSANATYAGAFLKAGNSFAGYITEFQWENPLPNDENNTTGKWKFKGWNGEWFYEDEILIYYSDPAYITIQNNSPVAINITGLLVGGVNTINSTSSTGYGFVFADDDALQGDLPLITAETLNLSAGQSVKLMFPGGYGKNYEFSGTVGGTETVDLRRTGVSEEESVSGTFSSLIGTMSAAGGTIDIIFGGSRPICRIVTTASITNKEGVVGENLISDEDGTEYAFASIQKAVDFAVNNGLNGTKDAPTSIEMCENYLIPGTDKATIPVGYHLQLTTAAGKGKYVYKHGTDDESRAAISRNSGNNNSFITGTGNSTNPGSTSLKVKDIIFDGKNFAGQIDGGVIKTKDIVIDIENVDFKNCVANNGGGIYVEFGAYTSGTTYGAPAETSSLRVVDTVFDNCISNLAQDRKGGGAIWTNAKTLIMTGCTVSNCNAQDQGGGVFHRIDGNHDSETFVANCEFTLCNARSGGGLETDARNVTVIGTEFKSCSSEKKKINGRDKDGNGGGMNVWALNAENPSNPCTVLVIDCDFIDCTTQNKGGGLRSTAKTTKVYNSRFTNVRANNIGGGVCITNNQGGVTAEITGCTISNCRSLNENGGGVYCKAGSLSVDSYTQEIEGSLTKELETLITALDLEDLDLEDLEWEEFGSEGDSEPISTSIKICEAKKSGGGIFHDNNGNGSEVTIESAVIEGCKAGANGGGVYTPAKTLNVTNSQIKNNQSVSSGGGIYAHTSTTSIVIDGGTISGNGVTGTTGMGGGVYSGGNLTLRNNVAITGNQVASTSKENAGGVYIPNSKRLFVGVEGSDGDNSTVSGNTCKSGASNVRLSVSNDRNSVNSVWVNCPLTGKIYVANAAAQGTKFGATNNMDYMGLSDIHHTFVADDNSLYGVINRDDPEYNKEGEKDIIWRKPPICKITGEGNIKLYFSRNEDSQAIFDMLDDGNSGSDRSSAFSTLRAVNPELYYQNENGEFDRYDKTTYYVKMLVDSYELKNPVNTGSTNNRKIVLTTSGNKQGEDDDNYYYAGRGECIIKRANVTGDMITDQVKLTLENITLDGGRLTTVSSSGSILKVAGNGQATVAEGATLQNGTTSGNGGGAQLTGKGSLILNGGRIVDCEANGNGGGVFQGSSGSGSFTMESGEITGCQAAKGGGVFVENGSVMNMSGGSIKGNKAQNAGGGIAVGGDGNTKLNFSGAPVISDNKLYNTEHSAYDTSCNVELGYDTNEIINASQLRNGASIGVYVPGEEDIESSLYFNHGIETKPFGTYAAPDNLYCFINDRNYLRGVANKDNTNIIWIAIYSLEISAEIKDGRSQDIDEEFNYRLDLSGDTAGEEIQGGLTFNNNSAYFTLSKENDWKVTVINLPKGARYTIKPLDKRAKQVWYDLTSDPEANPDWEVSGEIMVQESEESENKYLSIAKLTYTRKKANLLLEKRVDSNVPGDNDIPFKFSVKLYDPSIDQNDKTKPYNDREHYPLPEGAKAIDFNNGTATVELKNGETAAAVALPAGVKYTIEEILDDLTDDQKNSFASLPSTIQTGILEMNPDGTVRNTEVLFTNTHVICKITDGNTLLYYWNEDGTKLPAVFKSLKDAFDVINDTPNRLCKANGDAFREKAAVNLKMLVPEYELTEGVELTSSRPVTLTTAAKTDSKFPFVGEGEALCAISRGFDNESMIRNEGRLTLSNIVLDGGNKADTSHTTNAFGGIINAVSGNLTISSGTTLRNSTTTTQGGAVYADDGAVVELTDGEIIGCSAENGGAVYAAGGATVILKNGVNAGGESTSATINGNTATTAGAGIYLAETAVLNIEGNPSFGGTGRDGEDASADIITEKEEGGEKVIIGNFVDGTLTNKKNGQKEYTKLRQDIYVAGYLGLIDNTQNPKPATSVVVTGAITSGDGAIWVATEKPSENMSEAEKENNHCEMLKQFAVFSAGAASDETTMHAFRNAWDDDTSLCGADYLTGQSGDDMTDSARKKWVCIYWTGGFDVSFVKTDGYGEPLAAAKFKLYTDQKCKTPYILNDEEVSFISADGVNKKDSAGNVLAKGTVLFEKVPAGVYYMKETPDEAESNLNWPTTQVGDKTLTWKNENTYIVLVGENAFSKIGEGGLSDLADITEDDIKKQRGWDEETEKYERDAVIFLLDSQTKKAVAEPDIASFGIMNVSTIEHKVILRKVAKDSYESLAGAQFRIFRADMSEITEGQPEGKNYYESGASGAYFIGNLPVGKYYLLETVAPTSPTEYSGNAGKVFILTVNWDKVSQKEFGANGTSDGTLLTETVDGEQTVVTFTGDDPSAAFKQWMSAYIKAQSQKNS